MVAAAVFLLSFRLKPVERQTNIKIDLVGAILAALGVILISLGFNNLNNWGMLLARPAAPFSVLGLSPALVMIVLGVVLGQAFFSWSHYRQATQKSPLLALEVLDSPQERAATYALLKEMKPDVFLASHAFFHNMVEKAKRLEQGGGPNPFIDPAGYKAYIEQSEKDFLAEFQKQGGKL